MRRLSLDLTTRRARLVLAALAVLAVGALVAAAGLMVRTPANKDPGAAKQAVNSTAAANSAAKGGRAAPAVKPALSVVLTAPQRIEWPQALAATGSIAAWQEAAIGAELAGQRITEVLVNVGDVVKKGQVLARISSDTVAAELAQAKAAAAEAEAMLAEARANAERARQIQATGALSAQQISQYLTAEQTAAARVNAARAKVKADELRLSQTRVLAPDDGVISARAATVGSLTQPGVELFRLVRGNRLEWRAEVTASELAKIKPGMAAAMTLSNGAQIRGQVRMVAPTVDPQTRNAIVYVDLPSAQPVGQQARAGMFARGEFELGKVAALTLPQSAVLLREGFSYVYRVEDDPRISAGDTQRVSQTKVTVGRRVGDRVEITGGIDAATRVVASGAGFLADGDTVRVVEAPAEAVKAAQK